ncbi:MAG TPA: hypothetical protein ENI20_11185 [Bacteroides sp.]|nr:hypothetical protein [Bacteroides sp.]
MKHTLIILLILAGITRIVNAQEPTRSVGVRISFGQDDKSYAGGEFSFQKDVRKIGRRETDIGWWSSSQWDVLKFTSIRQWKFINGKRFNAYGGAGFGAGLVMYPFSQNDWFGTVNLDFGVDYTFGFPIQIAVDWRPEWTVINDFGTPLGYNAGFAVRLSF